jgi:hypothetical protein
LIFLIPFVCSLDLNAESKRSRLRGNGPVPHCSSPLGNIAVVATSRTAPPNSIIKIYGCKDPARAAAMPRPTTALNIEVCNCFRRPCRSSRDDLTKVVGKSCSRGWHLCQESILVKVMRYVYNPGHLCSSIRYARPQLIACAGASELHQYKGINQDQAENKAAVWFQRFFLSKSPRQVSAWAP